jgi:peptidoglycan/LPS O-acetylase OafA/YrhL
MTTPVTHIRGLDGLRGLAAVMVIVHHTLPVGTDIGGLSVFLFFILSGFLITSILVKARLRIEAGRAAIGASLTDFWIGRALRILPAYYVWLLVFLPLDHIYYHDQTLNHLVWYLVYAQNFLIAFNTFAWEDFTHTWSLAVEQQYYVFFAPLVLLLPARWHTRLFLVTIAVSLAIIVALTSVGYGMVTLYPTPSTGFIFMAAGALIAITPITRLQPLANPVLVVGCLALIALLASYPVLELNDLAHVPYVFLVISSVFSLCVVMIAVLASPAAWVVRGLETPVPRFLGRISYALYIIHLPVSLWMWDFGDLEGWSAQTQIPASIIGFFAVMAVSVPLATLSYWLVEKPFLDLKRTLQVRRSPPREVSV